MLVRLVIYSKVGYSVEVYTTKVFYWDRGVCVDSMQCHAFFSSIFLFFPFDIIVIISPRQIVSTIVWTLFLSFFYLFCCVTLKHAPL